MAWLFFKSVLIGLSIAAPVGPIGLLCIQRTLVSGFRSGFISGLGAATADAVYGVIGALSLTAAITTFTEIRTPVTLLGSLFLCWLGVRIWRQPIGRMADKGGNQAGRWMDFISVFALTLSNPVTIFSFMAIFAALAGHPVSGSASVTEVAVISEIETVTMAMVMVMGVFIGSLLWWLLLCAGIFSVRQRLNLCIMQWISRSAALFLIGFSLWQVLPLLR